MLSRLLPRLFPAGGSIAGRLTVLFTSVSLLLLLAKSLFTYWTLGPVLAAQERRYVSAEAAQIASVVELTRQAGQRPPIERFSPPEIAARVRIRHVADGVLADPGGLDQEFPGLALTPGAPPEMREGRSGRRYWLASRAAGTGGPIVVEVASEASEYRLFAPNGGRLWLATVLAMLLSGVAGYRIARRGTMPLQDLAETVRVIRGTTLDRRIDEAALPRELRPLGASFNAMLERLKSSFDRVSQVTDDIAHELRTPLAVIAGQIDVAVAKDRPAAEYVETLESVREEITALSDMVKRMLFLSRVENHDVEFARQPFDALPELEAVREFYEPLAAEAGIRLDIDPASTPTTIEGDRVLFRRAIANLVANALRFTPRGGSVTVRVRRHGADAEVSVRDDGCGIPAEDVPRLFDRFFRLDRAREGGGHVGLGLAIVKAIVDLHGGSVAVDSAAGRGTTVTLGLPGGGGGRVS